MVRIYMLATDIMKRSIKTYFFLLGELFLERR